MIQFQDGGILVDARPCHGRADGLFGVGVPGASPGPEALR